MSYKVKLLSEASLDIKEITVRLHIEILEIYWSISFLIRFILGLKNLKNPLLLLQLPILAEILECGKEKDNFD